MSSDHHSVKYKEYIRSEAWQKKRKRKLKEAGYKCQGCGTTEGPLEVHHKTYERLGREYMRDLEVFCPKCHDVADRRRRMITATKQFLRRLTGIKRKRRK